MLPVLCRDKSLAPHVHLALSCLGGLRRAEERARAWALLSSRGATGGHTGMGSTSPLDTPCLPETATWAGPAGPMPSGHQSPVPQMHPGLPATSFPTHQTPHKAALSVFMKPGPRQRVKRASRSGDLLDLERQVGALGCSETTLYDMLTAGRGPCHCHRLVAKSCPTLCDPINCSPPGSSVHGISQARTLEWVAISSSNRSLYTCQNPQMVQP